ncbi:MAG: hypothetical protein P1U56_24750 [Saprospiraceae bacterium]|nr:hypothetical protein [Saprospiraceae bacterium]
MKSSNILLLVLCIIVLSGMIYTNVVLKNEFQKIDLSDNLKNYISHSMESFSILEIKGSNGYPIEINKGNTNDVKVLRSRINHFSQRLFGDTLFIEFTGSNIPLDQTYSMKTPPGIIIEVESLSEIRTSQTYNRISNFSDQDLNITLKNSSITEVVNCNLNILNLCSNDDSQFVFSQNNTVHSLQITMKDNSIGRFEDIEFSTLNHTLDDNVTLVLSKNTFVKLRG